MFNFILNLFEDDGFLPRRVCLPNNEELIWFHNLADTLIWVSFLAISILTIKLVRSRKDIPATHIFWLFSAFILGCGITHLLEVVSFWRPMYRFSAVFKLVVGSTSVITAYYLWRILPAIKRLASPEQLKSLLKEKVTGERAIELSMNAVIVCDVNGKIKIWNDTATKIFGFTREEITNQDLTKIIPEKYVESHLKGMARARETKVSPLQGKLIQLSGLRKTGEEFPVEISIGMWEAEGEYFFGAVVRDITEREKNEELVRQTEERYRQLVKGVKDYAIFLLDTNGYITTWNTGAAKITGYSEEEIIGKHFSIFYTDTDKARNWPAHELEEATAKGKYEEEGWRVRKDGSLIQANVLITVLRNSKQEIVGFSKITRDITEKKKLEEQRDRFFTINLDLLIIIDFEGKIKRMNPSWSKVLGFELNELNETRFSQLLYPDDVEGANKAFAKLLAGESLEGYENRYYTKSGEVKWLSWTASAVHSDKLIYAAARDITEKKRKDEELEKLTRDLERSNQDLQQFAYVASHDLQEPIRMIISFMELLQKRYKGKLDERADQYIHFAVDGATRMKILINDLLSFSRAGTQGRPFVEVDLEKILSEVLQVLQLAIQDKKATVTHDPLPTIVADQYQIAQVFQNLISNAIKFRKDEEDPQVHISYTQQEDQYVFSVRDNGIGMEEKHIPKLFSLFKRLHSREKYEGTGIGLAICKKIVDRHGGKIWVTSEVGKGTTFSFSIPKLQVNQGS